MAETTILDGAMGTLLQGAGLRLGQRPEVFALEHPEVIENIHRSYIQAGSDVIYSNTFGANRHKLAGTGHDTKAIIRANVEIARQAAASASRAVRVALDVGPIGELMQPLGSLSFDDAYETFREIIEAGKQAGADLVVFETMTDLYELKAAVLAAKENSSLPVWATMSFEENGMTFAGTGIESMACTLTTLGVDALGINCSLGPVQVLPLVKRLKEWTDLPIIVKPNAGLPDPATGVYMITPRQFSEDMKAFRDIGVEILGGCCGTSPAFIEELSRLKTEGKPEAADRHGKLFNGVCSASKTVPFTGVKVIGERINPTGKKRFQQALREHDMNYVMERAIEQADAGADILDINVGLPGLDEAALMKDVVQAVQSVVTLPLQIDSSNPKAIEAGLRYANGRAIVNSVSAEPGKMEAILPIVRKYGAAVIGLTLSKGLPQTAQERLDIARHIMDTALSYGLKKEDILIDCLTLTVSAQQEQAAQTLRAVRMVHEKLGLHQVLGVSNIAYGLPEKSHVISSFLTQALHCGLDFPIINPNSTAIMDAVAAFRALSGEDAGCGKYIERFTASERTTSSESPVTSSMDIRTAILKGLGKETRNLTEKLLETKSALEIIDQYLIPALDTVGEKYERQELFLPQLINSANAACKGFELLRSHLAKSGKESLCKGKIVMATVEGDIHDIGKNIVKTVLENYGYQVTDLGKDVPVNVVAEAVVREDARLVGLSALMTTTVSSMKRTIEAIRATGHECTIFVGGAVLTEEYAMEIGADYYTKDAKASADVARKVLG